jgi:hypothetical protein
MAFIPTNMSIRRRPWLTLLYFALSLAVPLGLLYPALVYSDLAGLGGYDGFATPAMMLEHGAWATTNSRSLVYTLFSIVNWVWLLSLMNTPVAIGISVKR